VSSEANSKLSDWGGADVAAPGAAPGPVASLRARSSRGTPIVSSFPSRPAAAAIPRRPSAPSAVSDHAALRPPPPPRDPSIRGSGAGPRVRSGGGPPRSPRRRGGALGRSVCPPFSRNSCRRAMPGTTPFSVTHHLEGVVSQRALRHRGQWEWGGGGSFSPEAHPGICLPVFPSHRSLQLARDRSVMLRGGRRILRSRWPQGPGDRYPAPPPPPPPGPPVAPTTGSAGRPAAWVEGHPDAHPPPSRGGGEGIDSARRPTHRPGRRPVPRPAPAAAPGSPPLRCVQPRVNASPSAPPQGQVLMPG